MSLRVMTWAWSVQLPPTAKFVLMALADEADDSGFCFPSQRRLALKCSITDRTVRRMLVELETKGYVTREPRQRADGSRTSNAYRLACVGPPDKLSGGADTDVRMSQTLMSMGPDTDVLLPTTYPLSNPNQRQRQVGAATVCETVPEETAAGGWEFPDGLSAGQIGGLRDVLRAVDRNQGQELLDEIAGRMKLGPIRNPIRYCAVLVKRSKCGEFRPELGIRIAEARMARVRYVEQEDARTKAARGAIEVTMRRLPEKLRASLERMRRRTNEDTAPQSDESDDTAKG